MEFLYICMLPDIQIEKCIYMYTYVKVRYNVLIKTSRKILKTCAELKVITAV